MTGLKIITTALVLTSLVACSPIKDAYRKNYPKYDWNSHDTSKLLEFKKNNWARVDSSSNNYEAYQAMFGEDGFLRNDEYNYRYRRFLDLKRKYGEPDAFFIYGSFGLEYFDVGIAYFDLGIVTDLSTNGLLGIDYRNHTFHLPKWMVDEFKSSEGVVNQLTPYNLKRQYEDGYAKYWGGDLYFRSPSTDTEIARKNRVSYFEYLQEYLERTQGLLEPDFNLRFYKEFVAHRVDKSSVFYSSFSIEELDFLSEKYLGDIESQQLYDISADVTYDLSAHKGLSSRGVAQVPANILEYFTSSINSTRWEPVRSELTSTIDAVPSRRSTYNTKFDITIDLELSESLRQIKVDGSGKKISETGRKKDSIRKVTNLQSVQIFNLNNTVPGVEYRINEAAQAEFTNLVPTETGVICKACDFLPILKNIEDNRVRLLALYNLDELLASPAKYNRSDELEMTINVSKLKETLLRDKKSHAMHLGRLNSQSDSKERLYDLIDYSTLLIAQYNIEETEPLHILRLSALFKLLNSSKVGLEEQRKIKMEFEGYVNKYKQEYKNGMYDHTVQVLQSQI